MSNEELCRPATTIGSLDHIKPTIPVSHKVFRLCRISTSNYERGPETNTIGTAIVRTEKRTMPNNSPPVMYESPHRDLRPQIVCIFTVFPDTKHNSQ
ncbi:hypothetical protein FBUS_02175 [Fasciolopsis buskii]|uniref:Uncharacterized protein n=1 Tax=Fasciolopsis buskii TaxID=27845 RepID=A0A8E0VIF7_9TREM|nr:hypothetical protein FBUS_02175 [Fasciolopsis buski]